ncbi:MAG: response regulator, partial [Salinivirgaceae bacterium]|nr:response regulator [Salinivirgaceae bacterium]
MRKRLYSSIVFILLFCTITLNGHDSIPDYYKIIRDANECLSKDPHKSLRIVDSAKNVFLDMDQSLLFEVESQAAFYTKDYLRSYLALMKIDSILSTTSELPRLAVNYNRIGILLTKWEAYDKALEFLLKSYNIRNNLNEPEPLMFTLNALASLYLKMENKEMTISSMNQALKYAEKSVDTFQISYILDNVGQIHEEYGTTDSALYFYKKALKNRIAINSNLGQIQSFERIATFYLNQNQNDSAYNYAAKAIKVARNQKSTIDIILSQLIIAEIWLNKNKPLDAEIYLLRIQADSKIDHIPEIKKKLYSLFSKTHEQQKDYKRALLYADKYIKLSDSLVAQNREEKISKLSFVHKTGTRDKEYRGSQLFIKEQDKVIKQHVKEIVYLLILLGLVLTYLFSKIIKQKKDNNECVKLKDKTINQLNETIRILTESNKNNTEALEEITMEKDGYFETIKNMQDALKALKVDTNESIKSIVQIGNLLLEDTEADSPQEIYIQKIHCTAKSMERILNTTFSFIDDKSIKRAHKNDVSKITHKIEHFIKENHSNNKAKIQYNISFSDELETDKHQISITLLQLLLDLLLDTDTEGTITIGNIINDNQLFFNIIDNRNSSIYNNIGNKIQEFYSNVFSVAENKTEEKLLELVRASKSNGLTIKHNEEKPGIHQLLFAAPSLNKVSCVEKKHDAPYWANKHILIAEDEYINFEVLKNYIKPTKAKISHARNGEEILELFKIFRFDMVIMDIKMP